MPTWQITPVLPEPEYAILKLNNSSYSPEPWSPVNTLTWAKVMAWDLGSGRMYSEAMHAVLMKILTPEQLDDLFPPYPSDHPVVVTSTSASTANNDVTAQAEGLKTLSQLSPAFGSILNDMANMEAVIGPSGSGIGSNNWVIAGSRTSTGKPFLANDMHLSEMMPSIWYENGLHCTTIGTFCPFNVTGYSFPGVPGVVVGHNDRVAWGFTNVGPDVLDLYIEKLNPENPNQYEVNGQWVDMTLVKEIIEVAGGDPIELTVRQTRHGPVIWDDAESQQTEKRHGDRPARELAISMRWTALEPVNIVKAILGCDRAQTGRFRQAAAYFQYHRKTRCSQMSMATCLPDPGNIPIRKPRHQAPIQFRLDG
jgi:penicillin amidase